MESYPEGAATPQPRATPWETRDSPSTRALKGRHKGNPGQVGVALTGLGVSWSPGPRGGAPGWFVVAPSGHIVVVVSEESPFFTMGYSTARTVATRANQWP